MTTIDEFIVERIELAESPTILALPAFLTRPGPATGTVRPWSRRGVERIQRESV